MAGNLSNLTVASSQYDKLLCSETFVSDTRYVTESLVPRFCRPVLLYRGKMPRAPGMAAYERDGYGAFRQPKSHWGCFEILVFRVCDCQGSLRVLAFRYAIVRYISCYLEFA